jgi:magnesium and cobalt exporter, CNNM family
MEGIIILVLILLNGFFVMTELAVVSSRKVRLQQMAREGNRRAAAAFELAENPKHFLATVQIGITLIGILVGAFGGATIAGWLAVYLKEIPWIHPYQHAVALGLVVLTITYFSVVLGEIVPKRLALIHPERIALATASLFRIIALIGLPAVRGLSLSSDLVMKVLGVRKSQEPPVTEEEIKLLIEQGTQAGVFVETEQELVKSIFRLADREVSILMTPRRDIVWLDLDDGEEFNHHKIMESPFSRFPVGQGSQDNVLGIIRAKDALAHCQSDRGLDLKAVMKPALFVPENLPALQLLENFKKSRPHLALVVDEYGGIQGLVTLNDILEAIVGDIPATGQPAEPGAKQREDGSWLVDGLMPVDEFKDLFRLKTMPEEEAGIYQTLGGFMMTQLGRIPEPADHFEWQGMRFEIMDMDGKRVDKILVTLPD